MLGHYLSVAVLTFRKSPFVAIANITVLALGLTAFVATYAVSDFWNGAERQFENAQRTFVISSRIEMRRWRMFAGRPTPAGPISISGLRSWPKMLMN